MSNTSEHFLFEVFRAARQFREASELLDMKTNDYTPGDDVRPYRRAALSAREVLFNKVIAAEPILEKEKA